MAGTVNRHPPVMPASYARILLELGLEWDLTQGQILAGTRLHPDSLQQTDQRVSGRDAARMSRNVLQLSGRDELGFELGFRVKPTSHGFIGYAVMSSANLREVAELIFKFFRLRLSDIRMTPSMDGDTLVITHTDLADFGPLRPFIYEAMFTVTYTHLEFLLGHRPADIEFSFAWPEPDYFDRYAARLPEIRWDTGLNQIRLNPALLDQPIVTADPTAARQAVSVARDELARMGRSPQDVAAQVQAELRPGPYGYPDLATVASQLHMSASTLKRKLRKQGTRFQVLLDNARHKDAVHLMKNTNMTLNEISQLLGFSDPACFTRAFRRWTGSVPSQARP